MDRIISRPKNTSNDTVLEQRRYSSNDTVLRRKNTVIAGRKIYEKREAERESEVEKNTIDFVEGNRRSNLDEAKTSHQEVMSELKGLFDEFLGADTSVNQKDRSDRTIRLERVVDPPSQSKTDLTQQKAVSLVQDKKRKKLSEYSLAELTEKILKKVILIRHEGDIYFYNGRTYQIVANQQELLELMVNHVDLTGFNCMATKKFSDLLSYMKAREDLIPEDYAEKICETKYFVVLKNGILDLRSLKLLRHSPEHLTFYELDAEWRKNTDVKYFRKFLRDVSGGDHEIETRIKETIGYLLSPSNDGKCFFVLGVAHDSGKSTVGRLLQEIIGERYVVYRATYQMSNQFALGDTQGKILNMAMDLPKGKLDSKTVALLKQISGGDQITIERKYEHMRSVRSKMRFLFASNYPVTIPRADDDDAFWERMIVVPFLYSIPKAELDHDLLDKLLEERDGIVEICLHAVHGIIKRRYQFSKCQAADKMKQKWRYQTEDFSGTIERYAEHRLIVTGQLADRLYLQDVYSDYCDFCYQYDLEEVTYDYFTNWMKMNLTKCQFGRLRCKPEDNPRAGVKGLKVKV